jgi:hypothetical protein
VTTLSSFRVRGNSDPGCPQLPVGVHATALARASDPAFKAAMAIADTIMTGHAVRLVDGLEASADTKSTAEPAKEPAE